MNDLGKHQCPKFVLALMNPAQNGTFVSQTIRVLVAECSSSLSRPHHGDVSCTRSRSSGSECTYSCSTGFQLTGGSPTRICALSGSTASWDGSAPTCARKCSSLIPDFCDSFEFVYLINSIYHTLFLSDPKLFKEYNSTFVSCLYKSLLHIMTNHRRTAPW